MVRVALGIAISAIFVVANGCSSEGGARSGADLNALSIYYLDYARSNRRPPADEQVLREFIGSAPAEHRKRLNVENIDDIFVSPRDGKPYIVVYGESTQKQIPDVFAYEQVGVDGKRWVARSLGSVSELEDAELRTLVPDLP